MFKGVEFDSIEGECDMKRQSTRSAARVAACLLALVAAGHAYQARPQQAAPAAPNGADAPASADAAIAEFTAALQTDPKNLAALKGRGDLYLAAGQYAEAIADYAAAIEFDRDNRSRYRDRGWAYYSDGQYQLALDDFNEILHIDRNDGDGHRLRGMACEAMAGNYWAGTPERDRLLN